MVGTWITAVKSRLLETVSGEILLQWFVLLFQPTLTTLIEEERRGSESGFSTFLCFVIIRDNMYQKIITLDNTTMYYVNHNIYIYICRQNLRSTVPSMSVKILRLISQKRYSNFVRNIQVMCQYWNWSVEYLKYWNEIHKISTYLSSDNSYICLTSTLMKVFQLWIQDLCKRMDKILVHGKLTKVGKYTRFWF